MQLRFQNAGFAFLPGSPLLADVSFRLEASKVYALMGANGSGKTTLFNLITGYLQLKKGAIYFGDHRLNGLSPHRINRLGICRTFQDLRLISKLSVRDNVILAMPHHPSAHWANAMLPPSSYKKKLALMEQKADSILDLCFLSTVRNSLAGEISYGQQKLLNLACCMANEAQQLLLDEPVAGIQPEYRTKIGYLIRQLKEAGKTVLLIEHHSDFIEYVADGIFFLREGRLNTYETIESLRADTTVLEAYM